MAVTQLERWTFNRPSKYFGRLIQAANDALLRKMAVGFTLNLCCGFDTHGDVLLDVDRQVCSEMKSLLSRPEVVCASVFNPPFRSGCFDSVIMDPPFSFYSKWKWLLGVFDLARSKVILSAPPMNIAHKGWSRQIFYVKSNHLTLRLWFLFERETGTV